MRVVVALGAEGCGGTKVVTASGRGHGNVTPEGGAAGRWMMILVLKILLAIWT
jgi:hypothetical protein